MRTDLPALAAVLVTGMCARGLLASVLIDGEIECTNHVEQAPDAV